jgi:hypothetical protein
MVWINWKTLESRNEAARSPRIVFRAASPPHLIRSSAAASAEHHKSPAQWSSESLSEKLTL